MFRSNGYGLWCNGPDPQVALQRRGGADVLASGANMPVRTMRLGNESVLMRVLVFAANWGTVKVEGLRSLPTVSVMVHVIVLFLFIDASIDDSRRTIRVVLGIRSIASSSRRRRFLQ